MKTKSLRIFVAALASVLLMPVRSAAQTLRLPALLSDGVVLQRGRPLPLHGWAAPGAGVSVKLGRKTFATTADGSGRWQVVVPPQKAAGPLTLSVASGVERQDVRDVYVGDVWLVSGQSNIDVNIERVYPQYSAEIDRDSTVRVRLFKVDNAVAFDGVQTDVGSRARWQTLSKSRAWGFSALGYFLGKQLTAETGVAQGVIQSSWGGTPIEAWLPIDTVGAILPSLASEARYYSDPEFNRRASEANAAASARWSAVLNESDPGMSGRWADAAFDDSRWAVADQFDLPVQGWQFNGSYWARQRITIDAAHAGQAARLLVGTLVDADFTYVNGRLVGHTGYQYPPRRYEVPAGVLREGDNVLAVRFVCRGLKPSFVREKPYYLEFADGTRVPLGRTWRVSEGAQMPSQPSMPTGNQNTAGVLWNAMLAPLGPISLSGVVWYQGESNTGRAEIYERELAALMSSWRQRFGQPDLPFAIVQLAGFMEPQAAPQESGWPRLRESQRRAAVADAHAGVVPAHDLGEAVDIHPLRKKEVAERAAMVFRYIAKGKAGAQPFPALKSVKAEGQQLLLTFDQPLREGPVRGFEVADASGRFHNVEATARGSVVTLQASGRRVRYAWKNNPVEADCAASSSALPALPFEAEANDE